MPLAFLRVTYNSPGVLITVSLFLSLLPAPKDGSLVGVVLHIGSSFSMPRPSVDRARLFFPPPR